MSMKQKVVQGVVWSAVQSWGGQAGSLVIFFVLARLLTPEAFGLVALANVYVLFMHLLLEQGFSQAIIQRQDLEPEHLNTAFWVNLFIGVTLALVGVACSGFTANLFRQPALTPIIRCFSLLLIIMSLARVQQAILERKFEYKTIAARRLIATLSGGIVGIALAFLGFGVWSLVIQQFVFESLGTLTLWLCSDWRPGFSMSMRHFRELNEVGSHILGFNVLSFCNTRVNDFLVGYFFSPVELGYYTVANKVLSVMTQLLVSTSRDVALPTFSRLREEPERFRRALYKATQLTSTIAFPTFLGVAVLAPELVSVLFGEQWLPSVPLMQVLAIMGALRSVTFFKGSVFVAMGKPSWWLRLSALNATLNLIGFAIAVRWGIFAVACSTVIRSYIVFPVGQWAVSKLTQENMFTYLRAFVAPLSSALVMAIAILGVKFVLQGVLQPIGVLAVSSLIGTVLYVVMIRVCAPSLFNQLIELAQMVVSRSKRRKTSES